MFLFLSYLFTFQSRFTKNLVPFDFSAPARCPESVSEISSKLLLLIEADPYLIFVIFFTLTHFESWKFYIRKVRKFTTNLPPDKTTKCRVKHC